MNLKAHPATKGAQFRTCPSQILYLTGDVNYCHIHLANGQMVLMSHTLKWYEERWPGFIRIHKQALTNPTYARSLHLSIPFSRHGYVSMADQTVLPIARRRLAPVQKLAYRLTTNR